MKPILIHLLWTGNKEAEDVLVSMLSLQHVPVEVVKFGGDSPNGGPNEARAQAKEKGALLLFGGCFPLHQDSVATALTNVPPASWQEQAVTIGIMRQDWDVLWPPVGRPDSASQMVTAIEHAKERLEAWKKIVDPMPVSAWPGGIKRPVAETIPKIIHMAWLGKRPLTELNRRCIASWREHHPGWNVWMWCDEESQSQLHDIPHARIDEAAMELRPLYRAAENYGEKTDILRLELLHRFGGVWVDCDMECFRPIDELIAGIHGFVGAGDHPRYLQCENAIMGFSEGHPLVNHMLYTLPWWIPLRPGLGTIYKAGPVYVDRWARMWLGNKFELSKTEPLTVEGFCLHPRSYFYQEEGVERAKASGAFGYHHWSGAWFLPEEPVLPAEAA